MPHAFRLLHTLLPPKTKKQKWTKQYNTNLKPDNIESLNIHCICFTILCECFFFLYYTYRLRASQSDVPSLVARSTVIIHSCMPQKIKHFSLKLFLFLLATRQTTNNQQTGDFNRVLRYFVLSLNFFLIFVPLLQTLCVFLVFIFGLLTWYLKYCFFSIFCSFKTIW